MVLGLVGGLLTLRGLFNERDLHRGTNICFQTLTVFHGIYLTTDLFHYYPFISIQTSGIEWRTNRCLEGIFGVFPAKVVTTLYIVGDYNSRIVSLSSHDITDPICVQAFHMLSHVLRDNHPRCQKCYL